MRYGFASLFCLVAAVLAEPRSFEPAKSLVRINTTSQLPNYEIPWNPGRVSQGLGSGFIIEGNRVMTNAHVVSNSRFLTVEREGDPEKYMAQVEHIAHDCDLAVLKVEDARFFTDTEAVRFGGIPEVESIVAVYGYPIGGDRLSVTRGIVSRVDFQEYTHSGADLHLVIQIDAAINPGNSGGPVLQDGKVVGVAFQGYSGDVAQNTGYMIPTPVIHRFLKDIEDGNYDHYRDLAVATFPLQNPAMRRAFGLENDRRGILVTTVFARGASDGHLQAGDVLLSIDGLPIASDGFVIFDGQRLEMAEAVERKFHGDSVTLSVFRNKKPMEVTIPLDKPWPSRMDAHAYGVQPRFVLFGGLLFQPLSRDFLKETGINDLRVMYYFDHYTRDQMYLRHEDVVILSEILPDPINTYLTDFRFKILESVNGKVIGNLRDAAEAFTADAPQYVLRFIGEGRPLVLEKADVEAARERIRKRYNVVSEQRLSENEGEK